MDCGCVYEHAAVYEALPELLDTIHSDTGVPGLQVTPIATLIVPSPLASVDPVFCGEYQGAFTNTLTLAFGLLVCTVTEPVAEPLLNV